MKVQGHKMKSVLFDYRCTLWVEVYILNRQRAARDMHLTLTQFKTPEWFFVLKWPLWPPMKAF